MALKKLTFLWTLSLCLVSCKTPVPDITDKPFIEQCVNSHNEWRGKVSPPAADMKYMTWDKTLAKLAKEWTAKCKYAHRPCLAQPYACTKKYRLVGENIWLGSHHLFSPRFAVIGWYNETASFDFDTVSCSGITCGHYTQVVWAKSHKVGCAVAMCPNLGASYALFICNYGPAGNLAKTRPYTKGEPCSMCSEGDKCVENLCQNTTELLRSMSQRTTCNPFSLGFVVLKTLCHLHT